MIEIPPRFAGQPPVNPEASAEVARSGGWHGKGAAGLADDVRYYGQWMRDEAERRIGQLYPKADVTAEMATERPDLKPYVGTKLTVIAWLWARTVKSPNPAFASVDVPLASTFMLSTKAGKEAYVEPAIENGSYRFTVKVGKSKDAEAAKRGTKLARGANFKCLMSGTPIAGDYIKAEGEAGRMGSRLMAIVAAGDRERVYLAPMAEHERIAHCERPADVPTQELPLDDTANFWCTLYGLTRFADLFTPRQLVALTTFSDLVGEARERIRADALAASLPDNGKPYCDGGIGATAYADAADLYLGLGVGRSANYWSSLTPWGGDFIVQTFGRQAIPMVWDHAEGNPLSTSTGNWTGALEWVGKVIIGALPALQAGVATQGDAQTQVSSRDRVVSTDPPYYDNIAYADLSDFFYVVAAPLVAAGFPQSFRHTGGAQN